MQKAMLWGPPVCHIICLQPHQEPGYMIIIIPLHVYIHRRIQVLLALHSFSSIQTSVFNDLRLTLLASLSCITQMQAAISLDFPTTTSTKGRVSPLSPRPSSSTSLSSRSARPGHQSTQSNQSDGSMVSSTSDLSSAKVLWKQQRPQTYGDALPTHHPIPLASHHYPLLVPRHYPNKDSSVPLTPGGEPVHINFINLSSDIKMKHKEIRI